MRDFRDAKAMAQSLREALSAKQISISHGESLEFVSRMLGIGDWNTLSALIKNDRPEPVVASLTETGESSAPGDRAQRLAEQAAPRSTVPFDPTHFDKYVGYYQLRPTMVAIVTREGNAFYSQLSSQQPVQFYPESETKFFATTIPAQITFVTDAQGNATELVLHQGGGERRAIRIDEATAKRLTDAMAQRIAANTPSPGTEEAVRRHLAPLPHGEPNYDMMEPALAEMARRQWPTLKPVQVALGALKSVSFVEVGPGGWDEYEATFEHGAWYWTVYPPGPDGKVYGMGGRPAQAPA